MISVIIGAGKTTISRLFFRFYDVLGGAVKVNGKDVRMVTQKSLRGSIGVVPQTASMFNATIRENIRYGRRGGTQEELDQAARDAQLLDFIESMDDGWDTAVGDRGLKLSGGEKQRAAIARCLMKDPPFVLLDEATSALGKSTTYPSRYILRSIKVLRILIVRFPFPPFQIQLPKVAYKRLWIGWDHIVLYWLLPTDWVLFATPTILSC